MKTGFVFLFVLSSMSSSFATAPPPYIGVGASGALFSAPLQENDPADLNLANLAAQLQLGRDDLLIAFQLYMEREKGVTFLPNPNKPYFNALISVALADSGLGILMEAAAINAPLSPIPLCFFITNVWKAVAEL